MDKAKFRETMQQAAEMFGGGKTDENWLDFLIEGDTLAKDIEPHDPVLSGMMIQLMTQIRGIAQHIKSRTETDSKAA